MILFQILGTELFINMKEIFYCLFTIKMKVVLKFNLSAKYQTGVRHTVTSILAR